MKRDRKSEIEKWTAQLLQEINLVDGEVFLDGLNNEEAGP